MPPVRQYRRKTKRRTTYNERYNALSALDVQTRDLIQGLWAQSANELKNAQSLLFLSFVTNNFQLMGNVFLLAMLVNYMNALDQCQFLESV
jgi:alpha-ketoglutarate-dependent taurine dioxygenase